MAEPRRPGRPRDTGAEQAILEATFDLIEEVGFGGLTVDAVAARAGVGKATIYRRWSSKEALVIAAASSAKGFIEMPDTGDLRTDLITVWKRVADHLRHERHGRVMPAIAAEAATNPELAKLLHQLSADRRVAVGSVVEAAIARGDLPADTDVHLVVELLVAPIFYRRLVSGAPLESADAERIVDALLDGIRKISGRLGRVRE